jgi:hypothetical protein
MKTGTNIINDSMPLAEAITPQEVKLCKTAGIPCFRGILYQQINDDFGNPILKEVSHNTVVLGGAILALEHLCNVTATFKPATLNSIYSINAGITGDNTQSYISLFGVGNGGSGLTFNTINATDIKSREIPTFIPLRTGATISGTEDLTSYYFSEIVLRNLYDSKKMSIFALYRKII